VHEQDFEFLIDQDSVFLKYVHWHACKCMV